MNKVCIFAPLVLVACHRVMTEEDARKLAQSRFSQVCQEFGYSSFSFTGPTPTTVGGAQFAYEWKYNYPESNFVILVVVHKGGVEVTFEGKDPRTGYEAR